MEIVRLLVDDSLGERLSLAEEAACILLVSDDDSVEDSEDEGSDGKVHGEVGEGLIGHQAIFHSHNETVSTKVVGHEAGRDDVRSLDRLHVHESLQAREEYHAGALSSDRTDRSEHPGRVLRDVGVLSAHHEDHHDLTQGDQDATEDSSLLWREEL